MKLVKEDLLEIVNKEKVYPMVMHDKEFRDGVTRELLDKYNILPEQVVFEVTERSAAEDMREFQGTIRHYKSQGYEIAIDDVGSCYSGLNLVCEGVFQSFAKHMYDWYSEAENEHGYVKALTKKGEQKKYPLLHVEAEIIA